MEVYAVLAYNNYYPCPDNVKGMFDDLDVAKEFLDKFKAEKDAIYCPYYDNYRIITYTINGVE